MRKVRMGHDAWQALADAAGPAHVPRAGPPTPRRKHVSVTNGDGGDYTAEEVEFMLAMDRYKRDHRRPWPDCRDVLLVLKSLGYERRPGPGRCPDDDPAAARTSSAIRISRNAVCEP